MNCPRCEQAVLAEREREGLLVDICPRCRGVWLDRGELEKLIARATRELDEREREPDLVLGRGVRHRGDDDDDDDDDDRRERRDRDEHHRSLGGAPGSYPGKRKRRWYESLGDIFD